ncbi:MAG: hypothetical protein JNL97_07285 [Verrucomicrobiales bacterium]|nr:hypothetical protein [Verrucomicrobiales bacterium]
MRILPPFAVGWVVGLGLAIAALAQPADPQPAPADEAPRAVVIPLPIDPPIVVGTTDDHPPDVVVVPAEALVAEPGVEAPNGDDAAAETAPADTGTAVEPDSRDPRGVGRPGGPRTRVPRTTNGVSNNGQEKAGGPGERNLRLNFRGVPLEMVLDYLSDAAGFIIILDTEVKGKVDVWSNQPLDRDEAIELLNTVLAKNGYAALRNGRTLTIINRDDARRRDVPVRAGGDPTGIPKSDEIVTQIIPVRFINAVQLVRDLQALIPQSATVASNEGGNAIVVTDTQTNIRRLAEIVRALDTAIASVSAIRVFPLKYADAKALATVVRDLFQTSNTASRGGGNAQQQQQVFRGFRGPGGGGFPGFGGGAPGAGPGGGGGGGSGNGSSGGSSRVASPSVVAVADERSNALVVSAPVEQMTLVEELVAQVDTNVDDVTELRVFRLQNSDPQEMADVLANLFPDPTTGNNQSSRGGQVRFGGGPFGGFGGFGGNRQSGSDVSSRLQKQSKVITVPDPRTSSIVVSAARELMDQIAQVITQLDSNPAKKQKVFVYSVENTDPQAVEEILRGLFEGQNSRNRGGSTRSSTRQTGNQLNNRATQNQNNANRNSGFGGNALGGGQGNR